MKNKELVIMMYNTEDNSKARHSRGKVLRLCSYTDMHKLQNKVIKTKQPQICNRNKKINIYRQ